MKLIDVLIFLTLLVLMDICLLSGVKSYCQLNEKQNESRNRVDSAKFISESFRNCCRGEGFCDLIQWQKTCKAMWNLDYIGWTEAENFMEVSEEDSGTLLYGTWRGSVGEGEVYCRK